MRIRINQIPGLLIIPLLAIFLIFPWKNAGAQESDFLEPTEKFSQEELAQMLAPVALYPDVLLSQVLMASTYPIEVIEAARWIEKNPELKGAALDDALLTEEWDPSVKALCHFPSVLALMSERISETTSIGNAFLAQEEEVMDMIQKLRAKAEAQGNLKTTAEQKVIVEKETIIIEPADPQVIYVPYYDPYYVYGPWWYPAYPPYYWGPARVSLGAGISYWPGFYFGFAFGSWSYFDWHHHHIFIDVHKRPRFVRRDLWRKAPGRWIHAPKHRRGVAYRDKFTARKYGQFHRRSREFRPDTRGFPESFDRDRRFRPRTGIDRADPERRFLDQRRERVRIAPDSRERQRAEPRRLQPRTDEPQRFRERPGIERRGQVRTAPDRLEERRLIRERRIQPRSEFPTRTRARIEPQQQRSRENIFNRVENGRRELRSSTRGRSSRQIEERGFRGRSKARDFNRGSREGGRGRR